MHSKFVKWADALIDQTGFDFSGNVSLVNLETGKKKKFQVDKVAEIKPVYFEMHPTATEIIFNDSSAPLVSSESTEIVLHKVHTAKLLMEGQRYLKCKN